MKAIENEYKFMVNEEICAKMKTLFNFEHNFTQTNYYFDTNEFDLFHSGCSLRLRKIQDSLKLVYKTSQMSSNIKYSSRQEYVYETSATPDIAEIEALVNIKGLKFVGMLATNRSVFNYDNNTLICIDESSYMGMKDFEIEIEFSDLGRANEILQLCLKNGLRLDSTRSIGKYSRLINRIKRR